MRYVGPWWTWLGNIPRVGWGNDLSTAPQFSSLSESEMCSTSSTRVSLMLIWPIGFCGGKNVIKYRKIPIIEFLSVLLSRYQYKELSCSGRNIKNKARHILAAT